MGRMEIAVDPRAMVAVLIIEKKTDKRSGKITLARVFAIQALRLLHGRTTVLPTRPESLKNLLI